MRGIFRKYTIIKILITRHITFTKLRIHSQETLRASMISQASIGPLIRQWDPINYCWVCFTVVFILTEQLHQRICITLFFINLDIHPRKPFEWMTEPSGSIPFRIHSEWLLRWLRICSKRPHSASNIKAMMTVFRSWSRAPSWVSCPKSDSD